MLSQSVQFQGVKKRWHSYVPSLFDFSLESVKESGWTLLMQTRDLHHSEFAEGNVMTEYEAKFSAMGNPIYKLEAVHDKKA